ncbi:hypothetical protein BDZ45DRAFT_243735 [Acephala macrosclerotiorum]|nr:hypothetical protein BDZ45DRAFT_243735 [Acephala macrosclerotiorum]
MPYEEKLDRVGMKRERKRKRQQEMLGTRRCQRPIQCPKSHRLAVCGYGEASRSHHEWMMKEVYKAQSLFRPGSMRRYNQQLGRISTSQAVLLRTSLERKCVHDLRYPWRADTLFKRLKEWQIFIFLEVFKFASNIEALFASIGSLRLQYQFLVRGWTSTYMVSLICLLFCMLQALAVSNLISAACGCLADSARVKGCTYTQTFSFSKVC